jgi:predicted O-linked N-acetylglucosamine transferase (SPINDLY family)
VHSSLLASALQKAAGQDMSVLELIQTIETLKPFGAEAAQTLYATWIRHNETNPLLYAVLFNYSVVLSEAGALADAQEALEHAIALKSDFMPARINLGRIFERKGNSLKAVEQWSKVVDGRAGVNGSAITDKTTALNQMARVLEAAGQDDAAENMLRQSVEIDPAQREPVQHLLACRQRQCEWPIVQPWERVSRRILMQGISPLSAAAYTDDPILQLAIAWHYNLRDVGSQELVARSATSQPSKSKSGKKTPLRIGYLSSDLREHAVGHLMAEVLALHNRKTVEVFAYYCGPKTDDAMHRQFRQDTDHWIDIADLGDAAAARRIADDGIQILVDVNGYTREARTKVLAMRPAPVIVNWLGYPGTTGSPYHHYVVADSVTIPPEYEIYYSEKVLRLPCYQPNNRKRIVSARAPTRAECGLPEEDTIFCCFNGPHKITRATFDRWLAILARVPGSVLWLLSASSQVEEKLRSLAGERGITPERLVFADKRANPDHLARYPLADLFLDCLPYGAHTTASDALWMGVPVLTLVGRCFAARVCGSLVAAAGIGELCCNNAADYIELAVALGKDRAQCDALKSKVSALRDKCTLFDTPALVQALEGLYAGMWRDFEAGRLPQPDLANLDRYLEIGIQRDHDAGEFESDEAYRAWWHDMLERENTVRPLQRDKRFFS